MPDSRNIEIELGDNGAGEHCEEQLMQYGGGAALGGELFLLFISDELIMGYSIYAELKVLVSVLWRHVF